MRYAFAREQRMLIVNGMLSFVLILAVLQLWLLTATTNAYLGGDQAVIYNPIGLTDVRWNQPWPSADDAYKATMAQSRDQLDQFSELLAREIVR